MNKLTVSLHTLAGLHVALLDTAKKKQQILISGEVNPLLAILSEEAKLVKKVKEAEEVRTALFGEQSSLAGFIAEQPDGAEKEELISLHRKLKELLGDIEQVNGTNQQLIEQSLAFTDFMIEQMLPKSADAGVYSAKANSKERSDTVRLFDAKA
jgi:flagellar biosynthesis/type III secretory pathway chaperone